MSNLVDPSEIERIVGVERHAVEHFAKAVDETETVYILHSQQCKDSGIDLRDCPFSVALDRGIQHHIPWSGWRRVLGRPVRVEIFHGWLVPTLSAIREAMGAES